MGAVLSDEISTKVNGLLGDTASIRLLEAGCGSSSHFRFTPKLHCVGIDISREQLERNHTIQERILGDLQEYPLPKEDFDVVVCWDVIEHLPRPKEALLNMFAATKQGGLIVLGFPNLGSIKGVVTKFTPMWFHEFFYRVMNFKSRPFKTYLRTDILPRNVKRFAEEQGFSVQYYSLTGAGTERVRQRFWIANMLFGAADLMARIVSFGKCRSLCLDSCALILRKEART